MKRKPRVLIVEDEKNTRDGLALALGESYDVRTAENGARALDLLRGGDIDAMLSDVRMPGMDGLTLVRRTRAASPRTVCILLTAYGTIEQAVEAMKVGAYDFLTKPVNLDRLDLLLSRALRERDVEAENRSLRERLDAKYGIEHLIGQSAVMHTVFETIRQVAASRATVLVEGESGTGKELVAHAIHQLSPRSKGPFVPVHCAALSSALLESELFGHEKGAFTGATERRRGRFELADGGTLFLDEIGEIDPAIQVKILRVLEERSFERVGGQQTVDVDVRLVTATNRDLKQEVQEGRFREDLFYRLDVVTITLPPLRERSDDIPLLARSFLDELNRENGRHFEGLTPDAMDALVRYAWPGNVRELRNVIERMVVLGHEPRLTLRDVPSRLRETDAAQNAPAMPSGVVTVEAMERQLIEKALRDQDGNRTKAARQLGISRRTLHRKLKAFGEEPNTDGA